LTIVREPKEFPTSNRQIGALCHPQCSSGNFRTLHRSISSLSSSLIGFSSETQPLLHVKRLFAVDAVLQPTHSSQYYCENSNNLIAGEPDPGDQPLPPRALCGLLAWMACMGIACHLGALSRWGNIVAWAGIALLTWGIL